MVISCVDKFDYPSEDGKIEISIPGISFSITLLIGGTIVFGTLISSRAYFEEVKNQLSNNKNFEVVGSIFQAINDGFTDLSVGNHCIHLKEVTIKQGLPAFDIKTPLFRVPVGSVNGFSLGAPN
jgi:hypothetical protein